VKLRVSARAQREADRIDAWWRENRPSAPDLFARELVYFVELLLDVPTLGTAYEAEHFDGPVRKVVLERTECTLFYGQLGDELIVLCVWGARRKRGPKL
jgi:plasmid stabilization system protein ParE